MLWAHYGWTKAKEDMCDEDEYDDSRGPKKKTKMQKTVSKAAKVAGDAMENLSGALKM